MYYEYLLLPLDYTLYIPWKLPMYTWIYDVLWKDYIEPYISYQVSYELTVTVTIEIETTHTVHHRFS